MEKNNTLIIILLVLVLVFGGYYLYQKDFFSTGDLSDEQTEESPEGEGDGLSVDEQALENGECLPSKSLIVDGVFEKTEGDQVYFLPRGKEEMEAVKVDEDTEFSKITLSTEMEEISREEISLSDFENGDQISAFIFCGQNEGDEKVIRNLNLINVLPENGDQVLESE